MNMRKYGKFHGATAVLLASSMTLAALFTGCGSSKEKTPTVPITVWCDAANVDLMREKLEEFKDLYSDEAEFEFTVSVEGEDTCKDIVLSNPEGAADIYMFADDQLRELCQNDAILEITEHADEIKAAVGGEDSGAALAASYDGKLYACPVTAGNGYFLYYNKAYFSDEDVKTLDSILEIAEKNNKKFSMDYSSGWYTYSFFKGAGLELDCLEDGVTNECNWNATDTEYTGVDVAEAMLAIASSDAFYDCADDAFVKGIEDGTIIAGVNGAWNASKIEAAWGDDYAATMLPTFTLKEDQVQMCSFTGYKLMGINANTMYPKYCMEIVNFLNSDEIQLQRFKLTGECPANTTAASNAEVQESPAVAALALQSKYGYVQSVADSFWEPASKLGVILASGNLDGRDLQQLLDETVQGITAAAEQAQ